MKSKLITSLSALVLSAFVAHADVYKIAGFAFDDVNAVRKATVVEGPSNIRDFGNAAFARYSETYLDFTGDKVNLFRNFDHSKSLGRLLGRGNKNSFSRHVTLPLASDSLPSANVHRTTVELSWIDQGVENKTGADLVVFEAGEYEAFAISVRKVGSSEFSAPRYQFPSAYDNIHQANAVAFDFSDFGVKEGEIVAAIRVRNIFNGASRIGSDRVDNASGQGTVIYPNNPKYNEAFPIRAKQGGAEFKQDRLGADLLYVVALHDLTPLSASSQQANVK